MAQNWRKIDAADPGTAPAVRTPRSHPGAPADGHRTRRHHPGADGREGGDFGTDAGGGGAALLNQGGRNGPRRQNRPPPPMDTEPGGIIQEPTAERAETSAPTPEGEALHF